MSFERRKVRIGTVVSDKMDKTVVVAVEWRQPYALYRKSVKRRTKFNAHDGENQYKVGDLVRILEGRPISKTKRWRVVELLQREDIAEVQPDDIVVEEATEEIVAEVETTEEEPVTDESGEDEGEKETDGQ
jgi:small subunit ribosomal protein S17